MTTSDDILEHYGVKGMKWGVRRSREQIDADSADKAVARELNKKIKKNRGNTNALSNQELQSVITRMNLEQQYSNLTTKQNGKSAAQKGAEWAVDFATSTANTQFRNATNKVLSYQVEQALIKKGALPESKKKKKH